jgi:hypothetical protein
MKQTIFDLKILAFGYYKCSRASKKSVCVGRHTCKFILDRKYQRTLRWIDLRLLGG